MVTQRRASEYASTLVRLNRGLIRCVMLVVEEKTFFIFSSSRYGHDLFTLNSSPLAHLATTPFTTHGIPESEEMKRPRVCFISAA